MHPFVKTPFNMVELIHEAVGFFKADAARKSMPIDCHYEESVFTVLVDRQIHQVIINLFKGFSAYPTKTLTQGSSWI